jgi:hypothetical protein
VNFDIGSLGLSLAARQAGSQQAIAATSKKAFANPEI